MKSFRCSDSTSSDGVGDASTLPQSALRSAQDFGGVEIDVPAVLPAHFHDDAALVEGIRNSGGLANIAFKNPGSPKFTERPVQLVAGHRWVEILPVTAGIINAGRVQLRDMGVEIVREFSVFPFVGVIVDPDLAPAIRALPFVDYIEPAQQVHSAVSSRESGTAVMFAQLIPPNITHVKAPQAWSVSRGAGVTVMVLDHGTDGGAADPHRDLPSFGSNMCLSTIGFRPPDCDDLDNDGHGTAVSGVALARDNTLDVVGVAPSATHKSIRVLGSDGTTGDIAEGLQFAAINPAKEVVNMSIQYWEFHAGVATAVGISWNGGDLIIGAAGNWNSPFFFPGEPEQRDSVAFPAVHADVMAVSGVDANNMLHDRSRYGPEIEITAPYTAFTLDINDGTDTWHGTSFAAPAVAGTAALIWSAKPSWTNQQVRDHLKNRATDVEGPGVDDETGYGLVNACAVVGKCPALSASIFGPDEIPPFAFDCTYNANVSGGIAPYSYSWSGVASGNQSTIDVSISSSGTLFLTVTDEFGNQRSTQKFITVDFNAPPSCG